MGDDAINMSLDSRAAPAAASEKSSSGIVTVVVLLALAVGGASLWFILQRGRAADPLATQESSSAPKYVVHLDEFTVNLADPEETHFLRVGMDLGTDHPANGNEKDKTVLVAPVPRIRDAILSVLTACKANDLVTPEGKARLKKDLIEALHRDVPEIGVREIYFTEFLVQR
jgi:flagellar protein FliL